MRISILHLGLALIALLTGCAPQLQIENIEPDSCNVGDIVAIQGYGFGFTQGASTIRFQPGVTAQVVSWSPSEVLVVVPEGTILDTAKITASVLGDDWPRYDTAYLKVEADPILYRMLAFGDSITSGVSTAHGGYTYHLEAFLDAEAGSTVVINAGKGGEFTAGGLARFESTLTKWNDIEFVLLLEGTNDVTDGSVGGVLESIVSNLREMIRIARDDYLLEVVIGTLPPRLHYADDQDSPTTLELVEEIRDLAVEEGVLLADHYLYFTGLPEWETLYYDTVHPNNQGYQALADSWVEGALEYLLP